MAHNINHLKTETPAGLDTSWKVNKPKNNNMKNKKDGGAPNYFSMNYKANKNNAQDANTASTFKDPDGVAMAGGTAFNDGHMNYGTVPLNEGHDKDDKKKKKTKFPKRDSLNPFSSDYTGIFSGSNPYIRRTGSQKSEAGTIFE